LELDQLPQVKPSFKISSKRNFRWKGILRTCMRRPVASATMGVHVRAIPFHPDHHSIVNHLTGATKRFGNAPPRINPSKLAEIKAYVKDYVSRKYTPLASDLDFSVPTWLGAGHYAGWKKEAILKAVERTNGHLSQGDKNVSGFIKSEFYTEPKYPRFINARQDPFKAAVGPYLKLIESVVFDDPFFIKKIPIIDRPDYIYEHIYRPDANYITTDYSSFEASFVAEVMDAIQFVLYEHMLQFVPKGAEILKLLRETLCGVNRISTSQFDMEIEATRMTGEMDTSLGNGFSNLMLMKFLCFKLNIPEDHLKGVIEGDDGLFSLPSNTIYPTTQDFADLGFVMKMEVVQNLNEASFCGLVFDEQDRLAITDPRKLICTFDWIHDRYLNASKKKKFSILRTKALSILYQFPGCPVLTEMALAILRTTAGHRLNVEYFREIGEIHKFLILKDALSYFKHRKRAGVCEIPIGTRLLMEKLFKISIETQLNLEQQFKMIKYPCEVTNKSLYDILDPRWMVTYDKYVKNRISIGENFDYSIRTLNILYGRNLSFSLD
jgi:hypothetical protein